MLNQYTKDKANTIRSDIKQYKSKVPIIEKKLNKLNNLSLNLYEKLDKDLLNLKQELKKTRNSKSIQKIIALMQRISVLKNQQQENKITSVAFTKEGVAILGQLFTEFKKPFEPFEKHIDSKAHYLIEKFYNLLNEEVSLLTKKIKSIGPIKNEIFINQKINANLYLLLSYLPKIKSLDEKKSIINKELKDKIPLSAFVKLSEKLKDLVIDSFLLERKDFNNFIYEFENCLIYLTDHLCAMQEKLLLITQSKRTLANNIENTIAKIKQEKGIGKIKQNNRNTTRHEVVKKDLGELSLDELEKLAHHSNDLFAREETTLQEPASQLMILINKLKKTEQNLREIKKRENLDLGNTFGLVDYLTELPNRVAYQDYLKQAYYRWQRGAGNLSLALADIDNFNKVNTSYGYLAGNNLFKKIARIFRSSIRAVDFLARYNEDKFIFIFERTALGEATKVAEGLRTMIEDYNFCHNKENVNITISFGLSYLQCGENLNVFFARVHDALNKAKQSGRNRVIAV